MGLQELPNWRFADAADAAKKRGHIHQIGPTQMKATCALHKACVCWFTAIPSTEQGERDLVGWLASAADVSKEDHQDMARKLKIGYGMKPRKATGSKGR